MAEPSSAPAGTRVGDWQCPNAACINHTGFPQFYVYGTKVNCPKCGTGKSAQRAGDWCCPNPGCVNHQNTVYGSKMACTRCGTPRPPLNARGGAVPNASAAMVGLPPGDVPGMPQFPGHAAPRMGDWHCANPACKNHTDNVVFGSKSHCPICGMEKPAPPPGEIGPEPEPQPQFAQPQPQFAQFAQPQFAQPQFAYPQVQQAPSFGMLVTKPGAPNARPGDWHCSNPSCKNHTDNVVFGSKAACPICGTAKPEHTPTVIRPLPPQPPPAPAWGGYGGMPGLPQVTPPRSASVGGPGGRGQPGDWHCSNPACKNHRDNVVYASKTSCPICHTPKPGDMAVTFAATSRPGDWQCPNPACKNHINGVYASKPVCTICGEANPNLGLGGARERSRSPH